MTTSTDEILAWHARRPQRANAFEDHLRGWIKANAATRALSAVKSADGVLELNMLDVIGEDLWTGGGITDAKIKAQLDTNKDVKTIKVLLNSPGGDAFQGLAIQSLLRHHGARIEIEIMGVAASAATVVAMAADSLSIHEGAMFMIHEAWTFEAGSKRDMTSAAEFLAKVDESALGIYAGRTGRPREEIAALVNATTWMTAQEAVDGKFVDAVVPARSQPAASAAANSAIASMSSGRHIDVESALRLPNLASHFTRKAVAKSRGPRDAGEQLLLANFRHAAAKAIGKSGPGSRAELGAVVRAYLDGGAIVDDDARQTAERCRAELTQLGITLAPLDA